MAYSELIKDFNKIRDYMRQFYVYGFRKREEYAAKSARSYDNERRRIESWLGEYMSFRQEPAGKISYISVDSSKVRANPLYKAFKAKSFTANDIALNFYILDILADGNAKGVREITDILCEEYMAFFEDAQDFDEATVRNKLKEYEEEGILKSVKEGRRVLYKRAESSVDLASWQDALSFFAETAPVGVIGSFLLDKLEDTDPVFTYKHHYIIHALESELICELLECITDDCNVEISTYSVRKEKEMKYNVLPLLIAMSTENGRAYLLARENRYQRLNMYRLDRINAVEKSAPAEDKEEVLQEAEDYIKFLWNTSGGRSRETEHLEMTLKILPHEEYILHRLEREGKHGTIEALGNDRYRFSIDVYDAGEMIPWLRTFIGRIDELTCTDATVQQIFYKDLDALYDMYGGDDDAVS